MHTLRAISLLCIVALSSAALADEAREEERAKSLAEMKKLADATTVEFVQGDSQPKLNDKPVFRYDDQPRRLIDATVWVWTHSGRPIAFQKIETLEGNVPLWQHCFASFSEEKLKVQWKVGWKFESTEPGIAFQVAEGAPPVAAKSADRRRQLRELSREFAARVVLNPSTGDSQEMRLLTTPIFEFEDEKTKLLSGAVFGFSTNGTNPDLLIVFEALPDQGKTVWQFAPGAMTISGLTIKRGDKVVWERPHVKIGQNKFETWTYFQMLRKTPPKETQPKENPAP